MERAPTLELEERPFQRSGIVSAEHFWDRDRERQALRRLIAGSDIGFVEGPRRTGKSSLAQVVSAELEAKHGWRIGYLNLRTATTANLADKLVTVVAALGHKRRAAQVAERVRAMVSWFRVRPEVSAGLDMATGLPSASLKFQEYRRRDETAILEDIMTLLRQAPEHAGTRVALVLDEFQEVLELAPLLPELLKAEFVSGKGLAVVLMGSRESLMEQIAHSPSAALYRIGPSIPVGALPEPAVNMQIRKRFGWAGIAVEDSLPAAIYRLCDGIAQDVQTVCAIFLDLARAAGWKTIGQAQLPEVLLEVLNEVTSRFLGTWIDCSTLQQELLVAIAQYGGAHITTMDFLEKLNPHLRRTSAAVLKAARALRDRDVLEATGRGYRFKDPFFALYLRQVVAADAPVKLLSS